MFTTRLSNQDRVTLVRRRQLPLKRKKSKIVGNTRLRSTWVFIARCFVINYTIKVEFAQVIVYIASGSILSYRQFNQ